jgi:hypothetical protein
VDRRRAVRLGVDQQVAALDPPPEPRLDRGERHRPLVRGPSRLRQDPEAGPGNDGERAPLVDVDEVVLAAPEEHEVVLEEPPKKRDGLRDLVRRVPSRRALRELDHPADPLAHRVEVAHAETDIVEHVADRVRERCELWLREPPVDLEMHHGLARLRVAHVHDPLDAAVEAADGPDDGMDHASQGEPPRAELLVHRVEQEGRVGGVRLDGGAERLVPVARERRVERPHRDLALAAVGELEGAEDLPRELVRRDVGELFGRQALGERGGEGPEHVRATLGRELVEPGEQSFEDLAGTGLRFLVRDAHG